MTFFTALTKLDKHYAVVRTVRITNAKKEPPRISDAKFEEQTDAAAPQAGSVDAAFAELTGQQDAQPDTEPAAPKAGVRILSQVLGMEELDIFVRIDLMQLLPPLKLP